MKLVEGRNAGPVRFYGLSTCIWCRKTRKLLDDLGIAYEYEYVDLLVGDEKERIKEEVRQYNPRISFPTLVIGPNEQVIVGYDPDGIKQAIGE
ncbi:MAG: glutaredoxin family protein [Chloroflexi bacterium]|nr:glutaredoxin family protein [Chloroflexota bacterium]MBU1746282.1 glutaredoxin family protein [Chloroflexota bacterium]MBU1880162.1 glutaredoxin family protein [Chloroflexota bacterium]